MLVAAGGGGGATATNAGSPGNGDGGEAEAPGNSAYGGEPAFPGVANPNGTGEGGEGGTGGCCHGENGSLGNGGAGAGDGFFGGGGGGAGLYGGGGGSSYYGQPGAGGASWVEQSATGASVGPIDSTGEPRVTISYETPATPAPTPVGTPVIPTVAIAPAPIAPMLSGFKPLHRCSTSVELGKLGSGSGLAFSFTLSETSNVTFAVLHRVGSPAWSRCPRAHGHDPGSYRSMGQLSGLVPAGNNTVTMGTAARARHVQTVTRFGRGRHRISLAKIASKHLPPGTYVLSAKAVNSAGQSSGVSYAKFWVIR